MPVIDGEKWLCDNPRCGALVVGPAIPDGWEMIESDVSDPILLCRRCCRERDSGALAVYRECTRCSRDERSGEDEWVTVPGKRGLSVTYCADCAAELGLAPYGFAPDA